VSPKLRVHEIAFHMRNVRTRMPFRYGVATLTSVPILHVTLNAEIDGGVRCTGYAADILPPKWFDKDPAKDYQNNVEDLLFVARSAANTLSDIGSRPASVFSLWQDVYEATLRAGDGRHLNHLTAAFGSTLMERAMTDALGRGLGLSYHTMLQAADNPLGVDLGQILASLDGIPVRDVVAKAPSSSIAIRHTVGLTDPIEDADIPDQDRLDDGLPQSLAAYIATQGLTHFKVKIQGDAEADLERLRQIARVVETDAEGCVISLDGNEQYADLEPFESLLARLQTELPDLYRAISYIEQPLERSVALDSSQAERIERIGREKPMIVDESDGDLDTFSRAIDIGYRGVSTKNCKGLFKALANQALAQQRSCDSARYLLTAEDLMNLPVVPLHQDLTHIAALALDHAERNGHHYVRGLDHLTQAERDACVQDHGTLYTRDSDGCRLSVTGGRIDLRSLQVSGLGVGEGSVDVTSMTPLNQWRFESL
jgi:L-alanine-DL-glutamate epimerase-like enolase superfamily enzyme